MNALKEFVTKNKLLVSVTGAVTMCAFMVFSIIAFAIGGTGNSSSSDAETDTTSRLVADNNDETSAEDSTVPPYTGETDTAGEETTEDETEKPTTSTVDADTLPYEIRVNRVANFLTVYAKDSNGDFTVPYKAITVSCGKNWGDTPLGTYQTIESYSWRKMVDGTYAQYAYRIVGPILFHSVPYYSQSKDDLEWTEYNKLGSAASLGCVRMSVKDAKWLVDHCPIGTRVVIYDDANEIPPLGKPETITIPENLAEILGISESEAKKLKGWDPTDPDPSNPWHNRSASITYPKSKQITIKAGTDIEAIRQHFTAMDTCGNDITAKLEFSGTYDLNTVGAYDLVVSVTDAIGSSAELTIKLFVTEAETETETTTIETTTPPETTTEETTTELPTETTTEDTTVESSDSTENTEDTTSDTETTVPEEDKTKPSDEVETTTEHHQPDTSTDKHQGGKETPAAPIPQ